jgi:hypothetical protein
MYNADLGVLVRHRELALTGQVALAMDTMRLARRTIDTASLSPEGSALLEIRHVERVAHTLVTRREVRGEILRSRDVQTSDRQVRQLTRLVLEGRLEGVDPGWLAVVLQRRIELALLQLDPNVVPGSVMQARDPVSDLRLAERQAGEVIRDLGGILPGLRLAQLHRLRAEAGRRLHDWELAERSLRLGLRHARGLPGQLAKLAKVNGGLPPGIRLDLP